MATEAANAERQARAQMQIDTQVERISKALNFAAPPRTRADSKDTKNANEAERMATFLELVANHIDPNAAAHKTMQTPQELGGFGEYNEQEEQARREKAQGKGGAEGEEEEHFAGKPLSAYDNIPDDKLTDEQGVGEATAKEIVKARHKRDRARNR